MRAIAKFLEGVGGPLPRIVRALLVERDEYRAAIISHRSQLADDRCIEDDDRLYAVLRDGIKCDRHVGSKDEMLANCQRFIEQRCESGGPWMTYQELLAENGRLRKLVVHAPTFDDFRSRSS